MTYMCDISSRSSAGKRASAVHPIDGGGASVATKEGPQPKSEENALRRLVSHHRFGVFVLVMIMLNTLVLAMDHHPIEKGLADTLELCNFGFTIFFALEMGMKVVGLGCKDYVKYVCCGVDVMRCTRSTSSLLSDTSYSLHRL